MTAIIIVCALLIGGIVAIVSEALGAAIFSLILVGAALHYLESIAVSLKKLQTHFAGHQRIEDFRFRQEHPNALDVLKSEQQAQQEKAAMQRKGAQPTQRPSQVVPEMPDDFQVPRSKPSTRRVQ